MRDRCAERLFDPSVSIANGLSVNEVNGPSVSKTNGPTVSIANGLKIKDMTVKEIFELRKEGRVEEAYNAILPMYRVHHGKYTSLAMFWCAVDMMNLLLGKAVDQSEESLSALAEAEKNEGPPFIVVFQIITEGLFYILDPVLDKGLFFHRQMDLFQCPAEFRLPVVRGKYPAVSGKDACVLCRNHLSSLLNGRIVMPPHIGMVFI